MVGYLHLVVESQSALPRTHERIETWWSDNPAPSETTKNKMLERRQKTNLPL